MSAGVAEGWAVGLGEGDGRYVGVADGLGAAVGEAFPGVREGVCGEIPPPVGLGWQAPRAAVIPNANKSSQQNLAGSCICVTRLRVYHGDGENDVAPAALQCSWWMVTSDKLDASTPLVVSNPMCAANPGSHEMCCSRRSERGAEQYGVGRGGTWWGRLTAESAFQHLGH